MPHQWEDRLTPYALCNYTTGVRKYGLARVSKGEDIWSFPKEMFLTDLEIVSGDHYRVYVSTNLHGLSKKVDAAEVKMGKHTVYTAPVYEEELY